jgi:hypothetical protein
VKPDARAIRQHLDLLFGEAAIEHPDDQIELRALGQRAVAEMFRLDQIDRAVAWAERLNLRGRNVYVGVHPRRADARSGGEADIARAYWQFVDADDAASVARLRNGVAVRPAFEVVTGRQPHERLHCYWRLDGAVENLKAWRETQEALRDHFGTDNVVDPPRIMRLAGTISYPGADKQARGYVEELVTLNEREDAEAVTPWGLRQIFAARSPRDEVPAADPGFALDLGPLRAEVDALIDAAKAQGAWNANALRVVGALVNRGADDAFIHVALEPTYLGMDWRDPLEKRRLVQSMIDRTRAKWAEELAAKEREIVAVGGPDPQKFRRITAQGFDPAALAGIGPRQWIWRHHLSRRNIAATISPGGVGKTSLALLEAVSIASGVNLLGVEPKEVCNVWHFNLEDPLDEMLRRVWAICEHYAIDPHSLSGKLFLNSGRDTSLIVAKQVQGHVIATPAVDEVIDEMRRNNIGVLQVDPLISAHDAVENVNDQMRPVFDAFTRIANEANAAVDLIHHTRKQAAGFSATPGDMESARGAGALAGAVRSARTINVMSQAEAERHGIEESKRRWYIRVDDAKGNMSAPSDQADWYERQSVEIATGDHVGTLGRWTPPDAFDGLSNDLARVVLKGIEAGLPDGQRYLPHRRNASNRWVGAVLEDRDFELPQAREIVRTWFKSGVLTSEEYENPARRKTEKGVFVDFTKLPSAGGSSIKGGIFE